MRSYQKLILENQVVLEELDMECQEKINEDMAYALSYLSIYNNQLNVPKTHREMNNLMIIYGLSDMIYRGMTLVPRCQALWRIRSGTGSDPLAGG